MSLPMDDHPLLRALSSVDRMLDDLGGLDPTFLTTGEKARALVATQRALARLEGVRMQLLAVASDVADEQAARSAGVWLAVETRSGSRQGARDQRVAERLERWSGVRRALCDGLVNTLQAEVLVQALDALPADLDDELALKAEAQLIADAGHFGPRELRVLGRRVLEVVAPDVADDHEERALRAEERRGRAETRLSIRQRGDGVSDVIARVPDHVAERLLAYLDAFSAPRRLHLAGGTGEVDNLPAARRRGEAFCALLEHIPADGLPEHGGTATSIVVTIDLEVLTNAVHTAELSTGGAMTATEVRRLACTANLLPAVLGGAGEVLDLGRARRLFSPAQRKALAIRDRRCRAEGCEIPAAWCEAHHHTQAWVKGGRTDLADGLLLCPFHHHRAHDPGWKTSRMTSGDLRYRRRT